MRTEKKKTGFVIRALDTVERVGNSLPDPATIFFILTVAVILLSAVCAAFGVTVTYDYLDSASGQITPKTVAAVSRFAFVPPSRWVPAVRRCCGLSFCPARCRKSSPDYALVWV